MNSGDWPDDGNMCMACLDASALRRILLPDLSVTHHHHILTGGRSTMRLFKLVSLIVLVALVLPPRLNRPRRRPLSRPRRRPLRLLRAGI
jgi:hypothetical protein